MLITVKNLVIQLTLFLDVSSRDKHQEFNYRIIKNILITKF